MRWILTESCEAYSFFHSFLSTPFRGLCYTFILQCLNSPVKRVFVNYHNNKLDISFKSGWLVKNVVFWWFCPNIALTTFSLYRPLLATVMILRTCLHKLKSTQQGLKIGNNTNIFLVKRPNFIVLWQTPGPSHPAKCSFNYPTNRLNFKFIFYSRRNINF